MRFIAVLAILMATGIFLLGGFVSDWKNVMQLFISGFLVVIVANVPQGIMLTASRNFSFRTPSHSDLSAEYHCEQNGPQAGLP